MTLSHAARHGLDTLVFCASLRMPLQMLLCVRLQTPWCTSLRTLLRTHSRPHAHLAGARNAAAHALSYLLPHLHQRARLSPMCFNTYNGRTSGAAALVNVKARRARVPSQPPWDEDVAAKLDAMGCSSALVKHHLTQGATNHVTAAYEVMLLSDRKAGGDAV
eukprot:6206104-Pleurochrysis_carterae.AAC.4